MSSMASTAAPPRLSKAFAPMVRRVFAWKPFKHDNGRGRTCAGKPAERQRT